MSAGAAAGAMGVGTVMGASGMLYQGQAQEQAAKYNAEVGMQNAKFTREAAASEESKARLLGKKTIGQARANIGASGIQTDASAMDVLEESAANNEMDALTIRHNGAMKAWAYEAGAALDLESGKNAMAGARVGAVASLLKGSGETYSSYHSLSKG
jgi:hypothetical protein